MVAFYPKPLVSAINDEERNLTDQYEQNVDQTSIYIIRERAVTSLSHSAIIFISDRIYFTHTLLKMLTIFDALLIALLVSCATALLSLWKPKGNQHPSAGFNTARKSFISPSQPPKIASTNGKVVDNQTKVRLDHEDSPEMTAHKDMYHKLHNLEEFPDVVPRARSQLIAFFAETLDTASKERPNEGILRLKNYSREGLTRFMRDCDKKIDQQWEDYVARRRKGGPMELFSDKDEARWWLKQIAPVKYVDGAWLGYINKTTLPFVLRPFIKNSWQVLSEELGDGDLDKNHAQVYRELMKNIAPDLPAADTAEFIQPQHGMNEPAVWKAALVQMLISLIPHGLFAEILGFNMHFEALTLDTIKASRELKEVGIDPYYFVLHVSIDNADSGHTAIAQQTVCMYVEYINRTQGAAAAQQAWRRVQAGYILSESVSGKVICPSLRKPAVDSFPRNVLEAEVIKIFRAKALVGHKIHCHSDIKIGAKKLVDWLDPAELDSKQRQMDFLENFSRAKPWVHKGDSSKSRFVQELSWGGRMFGAFTQTETNVVRRWIDTMPSSRPQHYWNFTSRDNDPTSPTDSVVSFKVTNGQSLETLEKLTNAAVLSRSDLPATPFGLKFGVNETPDPARFIPLWFTHPCLLETFVSIPWKTTNPFVSSIVRILRAQTGFDNEFAVVAGMDEANKTDSLGLVEIGQELLRNLGFAEVGSLKEVLETWESQSAVTMAQLAMRPFTNKGLLIGMAMAFVSLHAELAFSKLLCQGSKRTLSNITERETKGLVECLKGFDEVERRQCSRGYWFAASQLKGCFGQSQPNAPNSPLGLPVQTVQTVQLD